MATISTLTVALCGDSTNYDRAIQSSKQQARDFAKTVDAAFRSTRTPTEQLAISQGRLSAAFRAGRMDADLYGRAMHKLQQEMRDTAREQSAVGKIGGMAGMALGIGSTAAIAMTAANAAKQLASGIAGATMESIRLAASFETADTTFAVLYKDVGKAKSLMADIKKYAAETPFETTDLKEAALKLSAFGVSAQQQLPTLKMLGDLSLGDANKLMMISDAYGKAKNMGRVYTRFINEFVTAGVPMWAALAETQHTSVAEFRKMSEESGIFFPALQEAMISLTQKGGMFAGGLEKQSKTLTGLYSTLKDNVVLSMADIGESIVKELDLKTATKDLIAFTGQFQRETIPQIKDMVGALHDMGGALAKADEMFRGPITRAKELGAAFTMAQSAIESAQMGMAKLSGNKALQATIEGIREERLHPRPQAGPDTRQLEIESGGNQAEIEEQMQYRKSVEQTIGTLQQQANVLQFGAHEAELMRLEFEGWSRLDLAEAWHLMEFTAELEQAKKHADDMAKLTEQLTSANEKLKSKLAGVNEKLAERNELARAGADPATLAKVDALIRQNNALEYQVEIEKKITDEKKRQDEHLEHQAKHWIDAGRTAKQRLQDEIAEIRLLQSEDRITRAQGDAAVKKLMAGEHHHGHHGATGAAESGSREAYSTMARALNGGGHDIQRQQLDTQRQLLVEARRANAAAREKERALRASFGAVDRMEKSRTAERDFLGNPYQSPKPDVAADIEAKRRMVEGDRASRMAEIDRKAAERQERDGKRRQELFAEIEAKKQQAGARRQETIAEIEGQRKPGADDGGARTSVSAKTPSSGASKEDRAEAKRQTAIQERIARGVERQPKVLNA